MRMKKIRVALATMGVSLAGAAALSVVAAPVPAPSYKQPLPVITQPTTALTPPPAMPAGMRGWSATSVVDSTGSLNLTLPVPPASVAQGPSEAAINENICKASGGTWSGGGCTARTGGGTGGGIGVKPETKWIMDAATTYETYDATAWSDGTTIFVHMKPGVANPYTKEVTLTTRAANGAFINYAVSFFDGIYIEFWEYKILYQRGSDTRVIIW